MCKDHVLIVMALQFLKESVFNCEPGHGPLRFTAQCENKGIKEQMADRDDLHHRYGSIEQSAIAHTLAQKHGPDLPLW